MSKLEEAEEPMKYSLFWTLATVKASIILFCFNIQLKLNWQYPLAFQNRTAPVVPPTFTAFALCSQNFKYVPPINADLLKIWHIALLPKMKQF